MPPKNDARFMMIVVLLEYTFKSIVYPLHNVKYLYCIFCLFSLSLPPNTTTIAIFLQLHANLQSYIQKNKLLGP